MDNPIQLGINTDPSDSSEGPGENQCLVEDFYWPVQDANFNVLGLVASDGTLHERYEYTPYGERTVYKRAGSADEKTSAPLYESQRVEVASVRQPYGLCDLGHQGLFFDKEFGQYDNRGRMYLPRSARFLNRDPAGYANGMSLYEYCRSEPLAFMDPFGLLSREQAVEMRRLGSAYRSALQTIDACQREAQRAERRADELERLARARKDDPAAKKKLLNEADKLRELADRSRRSAAEARQTAEEIAWQAKMMIKQAEEGRGAGGGGDAYGWDKGVKDYGNTHSEEEYIRKHLVSDIIFDERTGTWRPETNEEWLFRIEGKGLGSEGHEIMAFAGVYAAPAVGGYLWSNAAVPAAGWVGTKAGAAWTTATVTVTTWTQTPGAQTLWTNTVGPMANSLRETGAGIRDLAYAAGPPLQNLGQEAYVVVATNPEVVQFGSGLTMGLTGGTTGAPQPGGDSFPYQLGNFIGSITRTAIRGIGG